LATVVLQKPSYLLDETASFIKCHWQKLPVIETVVVLSLAPCAVQQQIEKPYLGFPI
jgi:hypothetical protein